VAYISSGNNVKHTDTGNFATLPPVQPPMLASPTLNTAPTPATVPLGANSVTLNDTASLAGGVNPTGAITFTLVGPGGATVDTETVTVNGDGAYTTPTGFTLPSSGTVTGTYQWNASYSGDSNNNATTDIGAGNEQVTVSAASPALVTTASPAVTLPTGPPGTLTLTDSALLSGGVNPTGAITFTLVGPGGATVDTETVTVSGNGSYATPTGFTLPTTGTMAGTYQWDATYSGDGNNNAASDQGGAAEQTVVSQASPTLTATPSPSTVTLGTSPVTLTDSATLADGYHPTGAITFTLIAPGGGTVDTEMVTVNGDGIYTTPAGFTLPGGTLTGTYQWNATYSGDSNNNATTDIGASNEQVTVSAASGQNGGAAGGAGSGSDGGQNGGSDSGHNGGADNGHSSGSDSGSDSGQNGGTAGGANGPTVPTSPSEPMVPVASQLPPLASGIDSPAVGGQTGQPNEVLGDQLPSLPGAHPARDLAFLPQQGKAPSASGVNSLLVDALMGQVNAVGTARLSNLSGAVPVSDLAFLPRDFVLAGARLTLAAPGGGGEQAPATSGDSDNNAASDTNNANAQAPVMQVADLALTKQVSPTQQIEGFDVTYTFIVHNDGPSPATNVTVTDPFLGVTVVGPNTPSQGTFDPDTGVWSVGTLAPGASATLTVTARVDVLGPITSTAHVSADQFDPDLSNNTSDASLIGLSNNSSEEGGQSDGPAFTVGTRPVTLSPLGLPPAGAAAEEGEAPAEAGAPPAEGPAAVEASTAVTDLVWMLLGGVTLLGGATLQAFRSRRARRSAPAAGGPEL
jgi:uncharacterized repeat protein (TIGR01451 family)